MAKALPQQQRKTAKNIVLLQVAIAIVVSLVVGSLRGGMAAYSCALGAGIWLLPNAIFIYQVARLSAGRDPQKVLLVFYIGELLKLAAVGVLFVLAIKWLSVSITPLFIGFVSAIVSVYLAPLIIKAKVVTREES